MATGTSAAAWKPRRVAISCLLTASLAFPTVGVARADMIPTEQVVNSTPQTCSDPVLTFLRRSDVEHQLRSLGVGQKSAEERVAAITDEEVRAVAGKLDSLYAGGQYVAPSLGGVAGVGGGYGAGGGAATILAIGLVAVLNWMSVPTNAGNPDDMASNPVPMDPQRKISEQDCTKPIVSDGGNLRCK
jgi:hypothetical protein